MPRVQCTALLFGTLMLVIGPCEAGRGRAGGPVVASNKVKASIAAMGLEGMQEFVRATNGGIQPQTNTAPFVPQPGMVAPGAAVPGAMVQAVNAAGQAGSVPDPSAMYREIQMGAMSPSAAVAQPEDGAEAQPKDDDAKGSKKGSFSTRAWIACGAIVVVVANLALGFSVWNKSSTAKVEDAVKENQLNRLRMKAQKLSVKHGITSKTDTSKMIGLV